MMCAESRSSRISSYPIVKTISENSHRRFKRKSKNEMHGALSFTFIVTIVAAPFISFTFTFTSTCTIFFTYWQKVQLSFF